MWGGIEDLLTAALFLKVTPRSHTLTSHRHLKLSMSERKL